MYLPLCLCVAVLPSANVVILRHNTYLLFHPLLNPSVISGQYSTTMYTIYNTTITAANNATSFQNSLLLQKLLSNKFFPCFSIILQDLIMAGLPLRIALLHPAIPAVREHLPPLWEISTLNQAGRESVSANLYTFPPTVFLKKKNFLNFFSF